MLDPQEQNTVQDLNKKVTEQSIPCQTSNQNLPKKGSKDKKKTSYEQPNWWKLVNTVVREHNTKGRQGWRGWRR